MTAPKLFVGPMSVNVVNAMLELSAVDGRYIAAFVGSRRQLETSSMGGGYVNNWSTEAFLDVTRTHHCIIERDHAGPLQGQFEDDGVVSLQADIDAGIKLIHIDPWKAHQDVLDAAKATTKLIDVCLDRSSAPDDLAFEVGTEEMIRQYDDIALRQFLNIIQTDLGSRFSQITYGVVQSGTAVMFDQNVGNFDVEKSTKMSDVCHEFGILSKEHNSDYLTSEEFVERVECGVDAFNIAPELGVLESSIILNELERHTLMHPKLRLGSDIRSIIDRIVRGNSWHKWVLPEFVDDDGWISAHGRDLACLACHYHFGSHWFRVIKERLSTVCDIDEIIKEKMKERVRSIIDAISSNSI